MKKFSDLHFLFLLVAMLGLQPNMYPSWWRGFKQAGEKYLSRGRKRLTTSTKKLYTGVKGTSKAKKVAFGTSAVAGTAYLASTSSKPSSQKPTWFTLIGQKLGLISKLDPYGERAKEVSDAFEKRFIENPYGGQKIDFQTFAFQHDVPDIMKNLRLEKSEPYGLNKGRFEWYKPTKKTSGYDVDFGVAVTRDVTNNITDVVVIGLPSETAYRTREAIVSEISTEQKAGSFNSPYGEYQTKQERYALIQFALNILHSLGHKRTLLPSGK